MKFWPWVSRRMYDSLYQSYQDLEADRNACEASSLEYEKQAMLNRNKMVARERERDEAKAELDSLTAEFHSLSEERDRLEMGLADRTYYALEATVSESTQGVNRTPCYRFTIRDGDTQKLLAVSDVDGEETLAAARDTLNRLARGRMVVKEIDDDSQGGDDECVK